MLNSANRTVKIRTEKNRILLHLVKRGHVALIRAIWWRHGGLMGVDFIKDGKREIGGQY